MIPTEQSLCFEVTPALLAFRRAAGHANRYLNTLLVGLETLRVNTPVRPNDLVLPWGLPTSQEEWLETRNFALGATMVAVVDGLDNYMKIISRVQGLSAPCLDNALNGRPLKKGEKRPTIAKRLEEFSNFYPKVVNVNYVRAMRLLVSWRNQFVHGKDKYPLNEKQLTELRSSADFFRKNFGGISIVEMVDRYKLAADPTLSDLSTMIACAHRLTREMDEHLLHLQKGEDYAVALVAYLIKAASDPAECLERLFKKGGRYAAGSVHAYLLSNGANHNINRRANAPTVTRARLNKVLGVGRNTAATMFNIERPRTRPGE